MRFVHAVIRASRSLSARLALYLAVALVPIGLLMVLQIRELQGEARRSSEAALVGEVMETLRDELRVLMRAQGEVRAFTHLPAAVLLDDAMCTAIMVETVRSENVYSGAAFVRADRKSSCTSTGETLNVSSSPQFATRMSSDSFVMIPNARSALSGTPVLTISHVVKDATGQRIGFVGVSVPYTELFRLTRGGQEDGGDAFVIVYDAEGDILTAVADQEGVRQMLPRDRSLLSLQPDRAVSFTATAENGTLRTYAAVTVIPGELFAVGSWEADQTGTSGTWDEIGAIPLVLAMWVGSLLAAIMAGEVLVARHVRSLRRSVVDFARGSRRVTEANMAGAPRELVELADSYGVMVDTILQDEARLEDEVHQKEVLLREVHHRVKNNLQLIASIMNMQIRQASSPEARSLMKGLHDRVMSLATVHRGLYQTSGLTDVRANELMDDILRQLVRMAAVPGRQFALDLQLEPIRLTPDQAVPLALFLTEAVTNALKYAQPVPTGSIGLSVSLRRLDARQVELVVSNPVAPEGDPAAELPKGLGSQLLRAFAMQLGGTPVTGRVDDTYRVALTFPLRALDEGEARHPGDGATEAAPSSVADA